MLVSTSAAYSNNIENDFKNYKIGYAVLIEVFLKIRHSKNYRWRGLLLELL